MTARARADGLFYRQLAPGGLLLATTDSSEPDCNIMEYIFEWIDFTAMGANCDAGPNHCPADGICIQADTSSRIFS